MSPLARPCPSSNSILKGINQFTFSGCDSWFGQKFVKCGPNCVPEVLQNLNKCDILKNGMEDNTKNENRDLIDVGFLNLASSELNIWFITSMVLMFVILIAILMHVIGRLLHYSIILYRIFDLQYFLTSDTSHKKEKY